MEFIRSTFEQGQGVFRLLPAFVPRRFSRAGRRLRLHPDDYYALGTQRGAIKERWFSSVIPAMNGPLAPPDEGMSYVLPLNGNPDQRFTLKAAVDALGPELIGKELWDVYGGWPMYSKFFDYKVPLFHHLHLDFASAALVERMGKPEAYYYPAQMNPYLGEFPVTYFGFDPGTTRAQVRERLLQYESGDNRITELSRAYRIELGTGWYTPPGVVHAPGSCLTYEPQWNSDVNSVYENMVSDEIFPHTFLVENCPTDKKRDIDYVMGLMDWEKNIDPLYKQHYFRPPIVCEHADHRHLEKWIVYGNEYFSATELTILPGQEVTVTDPMAYGCILIQGYGSLGVFQAEAAGLLRFGQPSADEYFVSAPAARRGLVIHNHSCWEPLVMLKHFGPGHPDAPDSIIN